MVQEKICSVSTSDTVQCPACGKEIPADSKFCCSCGASLSTDIEVVLNSEPETLKPSSRSDRLWHWLICSKQRFISIFVVICLVLSGAQFALMIPENQRAIQNAKSEGYDHGYDEGYLAGKDTSDAKMRSLGYEEGKQAGYNSGYVAGKIAGYEDGKSAGYDSGYQDGKTDGYNSGYSEGKAFSNSSPDGGSSSSTEAPSTAVGEVYVSNSGKIHTDPHCSGMKHYTAMSYDSAITAGYSRCKKCYR